MALVEIFTSGLFLLTMPPSCALTTDNFWTISHFHQIERRKLQENTKFRSADLHNILGTVDAISPIIALDPKDPFSLVELYDQDNPNKSCILILNGPCALLWQPAIQTGDTLRLQGLRRQLWRVPTVLQSKPAFQHFHNRIPSHVFVFSESSRLFWTSTCRVQYLMNHTVSFPPTSVPLVSLQGTILRVQYKRIDLECDADPQVNKKTIVRLFLAHFPMVMELQLSLQKNTNFVHLVHVSIRP